MARIGTKRREEGRETWCGVQPAYKRFFVPPNGVRNIVDSISGFNLDRSGSLRYRSGDKLLTNTRTWCPASDALSIIMKPYKESSS